MEASFSSGAPLPAWVTARPLLLAGASPDMSTLNATKRLTLQDAGTTYSLEVEAVDVGIGCDFLPSVASYQSLDHCVACWSGFLATGAPVTALTMLRQTSTLYLICP